MQKMLPVNFGEDEETYPQVKTFMIGVNITF